MRVKSDFVYRLVFVFLSCVVVSSLCLAVSSKVTRHSSGADLLKGETEDVVVGSRGTLQLGRAAEVLVEEFKEVWSINSIVVSGGTIFLGTSPNGGVYKYSLGKLTEVYSGGPPNAKKGVWGTPAKLEEEQDAEQSDEATREGAGEDANTEDANTEDANTVEAEEYLVNEHIFAMATDVSGRLLIGISGDRCSLLRLEKDELKMIFQPEPNDAKYIFAMTLDEVGNIYLGTGPEGRVYKLDSFGKDPKLIYDSTDKNILSLAAGQDGFIYAGSDTRGLIYKIDPRTEKATVLYDSDQEEITALLAGVDELGFNLYAAATSAGVVRAERKFAKQVPSAGRPEAATQQGNGSGKGGLSLNIANTKKETDDKPSEGKKPPHKPAKPTKASFVYQVNEKGFVTDIFSELAVFLCLAEQGDKLLVGTGNSGQLFTVEPALEEEAVIYEDEQASQITAVFVAGEDVYLGTANPAKLIKLSKKYASEGSYTSELVDAGQPAKWGKLQIEADIPQECRVLVAARSGNVKDVNDPTFSDWTEAAEVTGPVQLDCPAGRFCQYKLVLNSDDGQKSPLIREVAVASTVPNLAPRIESVEVGRIEAADKKGVYKIGYKAKDDNVDKLIYKIDFRKEGRTNWIEVEDEIDKNSFEWDGKTVEDGRYEIRVTASDERSNTDQTKLTGSRVSEPVVVDNTGPVISKHSIDKGDEDVTLKFKVVDELSAIGEVQYTVDSNSEWIGAMPDDLVYDTMDEDFTIKIKALEDGEHVISIKIGDAVGNIAYKTFEVTVP